MATLTGAAGAGGGGGSTQYRKFLLNRLTATPDFNTFLQAELAQDDEQARHVFHKVMVHGWSADADSMFAALAKRCGAHFVPVRFAADPDLCHFYTDSLSFVQKVISADFIFPYKSTMYNVDILFGDRTSPEMFGTRITTEELITGVVSRRFTNTLELDLSHLCSDSELREKEIHMYSLAQLALYKRLMLRMGRDTKILNLSNNNLTVVPQEIMNFFMRGDMIGVNLSDNNIESLEKLPRMSSLLERLWLEGNPLCEAEELATYVKKVSVLFPRLQELDGVAVNRHGLALPLLRNFLVTPDARALTDKFLTLYFSHYDSSPRTDIGGFYHHDATLSVSTSLTEEELDSARHWRVVSRNLVSQSSAGARSKLHAGAAAVLAVLHDLPATLHDPATFTVDVLSYARSELTLCVDGVFRERSRMLQFRRTFHLRAVKGQFHIRNDMLHVAAPPAAVLQHAFTNPIRKLNSLGLVEPGEEQTRALASVFAHLTGLKHEEVERRLKVQGWDVRKALLVFADELRSERVPSHVFADPSLEELTDEEID